MRERGADIKDIGDRLMRNMLGMNPRGLSHISGEVILVAQDLAPSDTASLDKNVVKGIVNSGRWSYFSCGYHGSHLGNPCCYGRLVTLKAS